MVTDVQWKRKVSIPPGINFPFYLPHIPFNSYCSNLGVTNSLTPCLLLFFGGGSAEIPSNLLFPMERPRGEAS